MHLMHLAAEFISWAPLVFRATVKNNDAAGGGVQERAGGWIYF